MAKKRLGEMLLEAGVIDEHKLQAALGHQRKWGGRLGQALIDLKLVTEAQIVSALSQKFGYQPVPPNALEGGAMLESALRLVPRDFASRHNLIPFSMDTSTIWVAMSDPANIAVVDEIRFRTGRRVQIALAGDREIAEAVRCHYFADQNAQVKAITLDEEAGVTPVETVVAQFGGGSTAAFDDFFSRPPEPEPIAAPGSESGAGSFSSDSIELPESTPGESTLPPVDLQDLLTEEPVPAEVGAARDDSISIELPLVEVEPEPAAAQRSPVLEAIERLARGDSVSADAVKPAQLVAAMTRLLLRKGLIREEELLSELSPSAERAERSK